MSSFRFFANATNMEIKVEIKRISILNHHSIHITFLRKISKDLKNTRI